MKKEINKNIKSLSLSEVAYQKIKESIVTLRMEPRAQADEKGLAEELSIGRTPIREALFRLVAENLVEAVPGQGFFVKDISLSTIRDLFETRIVLERAAVALASKRIKTHQIEDLKRINKDFIQAWHENNYLRVTLLNSTFHRCIYKAAENTFLESCASNLENQSQRLAYICYSRDVSSYNLEAHAQLSIKDHQSLIELLRQGNDIEAVKKISEHIGLFQQRVNNFIIPDKSQLVNHGVFQDVS